MQKINRNQVHKQFANEVVKTKVNWNVPAESCANVWFNALTLVCYFNEYSVSADRISFLYIPIIAATISCKVLTNICADKHHYEQVPDDTITARQILIEQMY